MNKGENGDLTRKVREIKPIVYKDNTLLYIINYKDDKGWQVISGDRRTQSIFAFSDTGSLDLNDGNSGRNIWLESLAEKIYALKEGKIAYSDSSSSDLDLWNNIDLLRSFKQDDIYGKATPTQGYWKLYDIRMTSNSSTKIGPLIQTKWSQRNPWNVCVPWGSDGRRCPTGCVAVAGTQLLYFFHDKFGVNPSIPSVGLCVGQSNNAGIQGLFTNSYNYSFSFSNFTTNGWSQMAQRLWESEDRTNRVAVLMAWFGYKLDMNYKDNGSGADTKKLRNIFSEYGIKSDSQKDYNSTEAIACLRKGIPVLLSASSIKHDIMFLGIDLGSWYEGGHAWIMDGFEETETRYTYYYKWVGENPPVEKLRSANSVQETTYTETHTTYSTYVTMNWGWDNSNDNALYSPVGNWVTTTGTAFEWDEDMIINFAKQ